MTKKPRKAVIGTCTLSPYEAEDPERLLADGLSMIDEMARRAEKKDWQLDLAVLPETFAQRWNPNGPEIAEPIDGPIVSAVAVVAGNCRAGQTSVLRLDDLRLIPTLVFVAFQSQAPFNSLPGNLNGVWGKCLF